MSGYSRTDFSEGCEENKAYLYIINCFNDNENFFKIGITKHLDLKKRFNSYSMMPYNYKIVKQIKYIPSFIFDLETKLHQICENYKYVPTISFGGEFECFTDVQNAVEYLSDLVTWISDMEDLLYVPPIKPPLFPIKMICEELINIQDEMEKNKEDDTMLNELYVKYNTILSQYPLMKEWLESGIKLSKFKALSYTKDYIQHECNCLNILNRNKHLIDQYLPLEVGGLYSRDEIVEKLTIFYKDLNLEKVIKATDIQQWFEIKSSTKNTGNQKNISAFRIVSKIN